MKVAKPLDNTKESHYDTAIFAGGCFWCMVEPFDTYPGIISVVSGYTGGHVKNPSYEEVCTGTTGHVEAVKITFDPKIISYQKLVNIYWQVTDPTDAMGQFQDRGSQYQPIIFYNSPKQKKIAEESKKQLEDSHKFDQQIVTKIEPAELFILQKNIIKIFIKKTLCAIKLKKLVADHNLLKSTGKNNS